MKRSAKAELFSVALEVPVAERARVVAAMATVKCFRDRARMQCPLGGSGGGCGNVVWRMGFANVDSFQ